MTPPTRTILALTLLTAWAAACSSGASEPLGSPSLPPADAPAATLTPGQAIWVAVVAEGPDAEALAADLEAARAAVGDYLAERIVVTQPSCYEGIEGVDAPAIVAVQDPAEHGVHAMYLEVTDDPLFYGPVTFRC